MASEKEGEILESYVTKTRDKKAALTFKKKALKRHGSPGAKTEMLRSAAQSSRIFLEKHISEHVGSMSALPPLQTFIVRRVDADGCRSTSRLPNAVDASIAAISIFVAKYENRWAFEISNIGTVT